jgi:hypothetical protein
MIPTHVLFWRRSLTCDDTGGPAQMIDLMMKL